MVTADTAVQKKKKNSPEYKAARRAMEAVLQGMDPDDRKRVLRQAAGSLGGQKTAAGKVKKDYGYGPRLSQNDDAVDYKADGGTSEKFCGNCIFYTGDRTYSYGSCSVVAGSINQTGLSDLWREIKPVPTPEQIENIISDATAGSSVSTTDQLGEGVTAARKSALFVEIIKKDEEKQLITGLVLVPEVEDSQGDVISKEEIGEAVVRFAPILKNKLQHKADTDETQVIESYQTPADMEIDGRTVKAGSWVMTVKVLSEALWKRVKDGEFTGFSIGGYGTRTPIEEASA